MFALIKKELNSYYSSAMAYIVMAVFLTSIGLLVWLFPDTNVLDYGYADLGTFFELMPYLLLFLVPAITMRAFAEELRSGTIELLLTKPITHSALVWAKFWANLLITILTILPTLIYVYSIYELGNPVGNLDLGATAGSYIGLVLLSAVFVAIGIYTSSLNDNQIVAFVIGIFICFMLYVGIGAIAKLDIWGQWAYFLSWIATDEQYRNLGKGLIDSRNIIFLLSICSLFIWLTQQRINSLSK